MAAARRRILTPGARQDMSMLGKPFTIAAPGHWSLLA